MKKQIKYVRTAVLALVMASCATVPMTGRRQLSLVSDAQIQQEAAAAYTALLRSPETKVVTTSAKAALVKKVGNRIAAAVDDYLKVQGLANQYNFQWEFNLIESPEINAWCMPGGKVAIYTGILPVTANEAGLATVMGHEIAHAVARLPVKPCICSVAWRRHRCGRLQQERGSAERGQHDLRRGQSTGVAQPFPWQRVRSGSDGADVHGHGGLRSGSCCLVLGADGGGKRTQCRIAARIFEHASQRCPPHPRHPAAHPRGKKVLL